VDPRSTYYALRCAYFFLHIVKTAQKSGFQGVLCKFSSKKDHSAAAIILLHNHPTGDPTPSPEDLEVTRRLCEAGELMGIKVLDHIIIGDGAFYSFSERGVM